MTDREIFNLEQDTLVKIADKVKCSDIYKKPCKLRFSNSKKLGKKEYQYGIAHLDDNGEIIGVCYYFHSSDYELVSQHSQ